MPNSSHKLAHEGSQPDAVSPFSVWCKRAFVIGYILLTITFLWVVYGLSKQKLASMKDARKHSHAQEIVLVYNEAKRAGIEFRKPL